MSSSNAVPTTNVDMLSIRNAFAPTKAQPHAINEFYMGGSFVTGANSPYGPIPSSGTIDFGKFRGASLAVTGQEYPPVAMTTDSTTISGQSYGNGTYVASSSPMNQGYFDLNYRPWRLFNKNNGDFWHWYEFAYNSTGDYANLGQPGYPQFKVSDYYGEWIQLQLPEGIVLKSYSLCKRNGDQGMPQNFKLYGSNNGSTWVVLDTQTGITGWVDSTFKTFTISNSTNYSYYAIVANKVTLNTTKVNQRFIAGEWKLFN